MIAPADYEQEPDCCTTHFEFVTHKLEHESTTKLASNLTLMFMFALPFVGFFAGVGVVTFRWITGI